MTSPYLNQPTRSLEEVRDELIATIKNWPASPPSMSRVEAMDRLARLTHTIDRLAQIQEQINARDKP